MTSQISRRKFIQLTVVGGAVAATSLSEGCKNERVYKSEVWGQYGGMRDRTYPYLDQPDGVEDGVPQYFATTCRMCPAGCGLFIRTMGGRAIKVEGNPVHPVSRGKTCARAQAALQHLYNPDRIRFPAVRPARSQPIQQTDWDTALSRTAAALAAARGRIAVLADSMVTLRSPTLARLLAEFANSAGARVYSYSLIDDSAWRAAARAVYGVNQIPDYRLDEADTIVAFNANFLEAWPSPVHAGWLFGQFRQGPRRRQGEHGRFVYVGPRLSMTAAKADSWLPCNPGTEAVVALGVLTSLGGAGMPVAQAAAISGLTAEQIEGVAGSIAEAGPRAVCVAGDGLVGQGDATAAITAVESLNVHVRSACVGFGAAALPHVPEAASGLAQIRALASKLASGAVQALLIVGDPNPVFTLPAALAVEAALARAPFVAALSSFVDETSSQADVLLPTRTFLEDWSDDAPLVPPAGARIASLCQPIIDPAYITTIAASLDQGPPTPWMNTRMTADILIDLARRLGRPLPEADAMGAVRRSWASIGQANVAITAIDNDRRWVAALGKGGFWSVERGAHTAPKAAPDLRYAGAPAAPAVGVFTLQLYPHIFWTDGRHANLPWMQEIPDPMTSAVWNNWAEINLQTAESLQIRTGDIVRISTDHGQVEVPAVPTPGLHPGVIAMPIGQGHTSYGRYANGRGVNPLAILDPLSDPATGSFAYASTQVRLAKVRSAHDGYHPELNTLVQLQDRPDGQEPEAVQGLIHETAKEWRAAHPVAGAPPEAGSIFNRNINRQPPPESSP